MRTNRRLVRLSRKIRARQRLAKMPKRNTRPEREVKQMLDALGVQYIQWYVFAGYEYDFYCYELDLFIETHGEYWHAWPIKYTRRDRLQTRNHRHDRFKLHAVTKNGKRILYVWEPDILQRKKRVYDQLKIALTAQFQSMHLLEDLFPQYKTFY